MPARSFNKPKSIALGHSYMVDGHCERPRAGLHPHLSIGLRLVDYSIGLTLVDFSLAQRGSILAFSVIFFKAWRLENRRLFQGRSGPLH